MALPTTSAKLPTPILGDALRGRQGGAYPGVCCATARLLSKDPYGVRFKTVSDPGRVFSNLAGVS